MRATRTRSAVATVIAVLALGACLAAVASLLAPAANAEPTKHPHTGSPTPTATDTPGPSPSGTGAHDAFLWQTPITLDGRRESNRLLLTVAFAHASVSVPWHAGCWVVAAEGQVPSFSCDPASTPTVAPDGATAHRLAVTYQELPDCTGAHVVSGLPLGAEGHDTLDICVEESCAQATTVTFGEQRATAVTSRCPDDPADEQAPGPPAPPPVGAHAPSNHAPRPPAQVHGAQVSRTPSPEPARTVKPPSRVSATASPSVSPSATSSPTTVVAGSLPPAENNRHGWPAVAVAALLVGGLGVATSRALVFSRDG